jgi:flavin prenyltransferase
MGAERLIVGITGASGAIYGQTALKALRATGVETHLVISRSAQITIAHELKIKISELSALADVVYRVDDIGAAISSLLTRAADVVLKERRRLVLMVRETPFHLGHLRSMTQVTEMGAIVMPPVPAFYACPVTIDDIVNHSIGRALDLFGLNNNLTPRWGETIGLGSPR